MFELSIEILFFAGSVRVGGNQKIWTDLLIFVFSSLRRLRLKRNDSSWRFVIGWFGGKDRTEQNRTGQDGLFIL